MHQKKVLTSPSTNREMPSPCADKVGAIAKSTERTEGKILVKPN